VTIQPEGVLSGWVPVPAFGTGGVAIVSPPSVGDQVAVIFQEGDHEHPIVVGRFWSSVDKPSQSPITSKTIGPNELGIFGNNGAFLHLTAGGTWEIKGNMRLDGDIEITGKLLVRGIIQGMADILAKAVSLLTHRHKGVVTGSGTTDVPVQ
jgi:phage baseplate assembly protein gpV